MKGISVLGWCAAVVLLRALGGERSMAAELKYQAHLVWGTDDPKPPEGKSYPPVDAEIKKKLQEALKWKNYFEVSRTNFSVAAGTSRRVAVSGKCELELKVVSAANSEVEVLLIGKGKEAARQRRSLRAGEVIILAGNSENATSWLVVVRRME